MCKKYQLTNEIKQIKDRITKKITNLYRIKALKDFDDVKVGDLGGYIEKESNLSHDGNFWVYDNAWVYGNAKVSYHAKVWGKAYGNAKLNSQSKVSVVPKKCKVYENDNVVNITDKTE
ncbi:hypothetical protein [Bartonella sp. AA9NXGY]|uniref:hypothetical protein n=1 Tax=Bartonella sp. AA9NXGY TaxID=3243443 RepID=UPI0035CF1BE0